MGKKKGTVTIFNCDDCIHQSVCCYAKDMPDICYAIDNVVITGSMRKINTYDFLDKIVINCKYYRKETATSFYSDTTTTLTNPHNIITAPIHINTSRTNSDCICNMCIHNCGTYCDKPDWQQCKKIFKEPDDVTDKRLKGDKNGKI